MWYPTTTMIWENDASRNDRLRLHCIFFHCWKSGSFTASTTAYQWPVYCCLLGGHCHKSWRHGGSGCKDSYFLEHSSILRWVVHAPAALTLMKEPTPHPLDRRLGSLHSWSHREENPWTCRDSNLWPLGCPAYNQPRFQLCYTIYKFTWIPMADCWIPLVSFNATCYHSSHNYSTTHYLINSTPGKHVIILHCWLIKLSCNSEM
jgi:hypothetical protein